MDPSLDAALLAARQHEAQGQTAQAIALYERVAFQPLVQPAWTAINALVSLRMRSLQITEAQQAFATFLERQFLLPGPDRTEVGDARGRILLIYGLESWESILFERFFQAFPFAINAGHFDVAALLVSQPAPRNLAFVPVVLDASRLEAMQQKLREYPVVLNVIADPLAEARTLPNVARLLEGYCGCVINRPESVAETARDRVADRLADVPGVVVPRVVRVDALDAPRLQEELAAWPEGLIVRPLDSQTGRGVHLVRNMDDAPRVLAEFTGRSAFLTRFHDFRDSASGLYTKMRFFKAAGELFPEHRIVADVWNIHSGDRARVMRNRPELQAAEQRFLERPAEVLGENGMRALAAVFERFDLDYVGIDFAQLPDGRLLLFEANPAMRVNYDHCPGFPYLRPHLERISQAFSRMIARVAGQA